MLGLTGIVDEGETFFDQFNYFTGYDPSKTLSNIDSFGLKLIVYSSGGICPLCSQRASQDIGMLPYL